MKLKCFNSLTRINPNLSDGLLIALNKEYDASLIKDQNQINIHLLLDQTEIKKVRQLPNLPFFVTVCNQ